MLRNVKKQSQFDSFLLAGALQRMREEVRIVTAVSYDPVVILNKFRSVGLGSWSVRSALESVLSDAGDGY